MGRKEKSAAKEPPKDQFDAIQLELKNVRTAVLNLQTDEEDVLSRCCESIYQFALKCSENCILLLELGAVGQLQKLVTHVDKNVRRHAGKAFGIMSSQVAVRAEVARNSSNIVPDCVSLLHDDDLIVVEFAVMVLANMCVDFQIKNELLKEEALPSLVKLLSSNDPDIQKHSLTCILDLAKDFEVRAILGEFETINAVLRLITSDYPVIQQLALDTATLLCHEEVSRAQIKETDGIQTILLFIENPKFGDLHSNALAVIGQVLSESEDLTEFKSCGNLSRLISAIKINCETPLADQTLINFTQLISRLGTNQECCKSFVESGIMEVLLKMIQNNSDECTISACSAIRALASERTFKEQANESGLIAKLIELLTTQTGSDLLPETRRESILSIAQLIQNNITNQAIFIQNRGIPIAIGLLAQNQASAAPSTTDGASIQKDQTVVDHNLICGILSIFVFISHDDVWRREALDGGLITALREPLEISGAAEIEQRAAEVVRVFVLDRDERVKLVESGTLTGIVKLLESHDRKVRIEACSAIIQCCQDSWIAQKIVDLGGLEILQRVNASTHLRSQSSEATFRQLLDYNLPAKYALTGHLSQFNHVEDGFYDVGVIREDSKFLTLTQLAETSINDGRPILLVKFETDFSKNEESMNEETKSESKTTKSESISSAKSKRSAKKDKKRGPSESGESNRKTLDTPKTPTTNTVTESGGSTTNIHSSSQSHINPTATPGGPTANETMSNASFDNIPSGTSETDFFSDINFIDNGLLDILNNAKEKNNHHDDFKTQIVQVAHMVSATLGGPVPKASICEFGYDMHIVELKRSQNSNILVMGNIKKGMFRERALLFKLISDRCGIPSTLEQGQYGRAWNSVIIEGKEVIVDLIHSPGQLYHTITPNAKNYCTL